MTKLNTIKDYNNEKIKRGKILLSSGDEKKIETYLQEIKVTALHIRDNYPDVTNVVSDFEMWLAMTKDILIHSVNFMQLIFTSEEVTKILAMCDNVSEMRSYWEELTMVSSITKALT